MKQNAFSFISFLGLAFGALSLSSCNLQNTGGPMSSTQFTPKVKSPTNPAAVKVYISTSAQRVYVVEGQEVLLATPATVGTSGTPTPKGTFKIRNKVRHRRRQSNPGAGYPMTFWMEFYNPAYGMHWGFVKPYPSSAGCVRLPVKSAKAIFNMVSTGTTINVANSQPWDETVGKSLPVLDDGPLPNPPNSYLHSSQVFQDAEKGKVWNFPQH